MLSSMKFMPATPPGFLVHTPPLSVAACGCVDSVPPSCGCHGLQRQFSGSLVNQLPPSTSPHFNPSSSPSSPYLPLCRMRREWAWCVCSSQGQWTLPSTVAVLCLMCFTLLNCAIQWWVYTYVSCWGLWYTPTHVIHKEILHTPFVVYRMMVGK